MIAITEERSSTQPRTRLSFVLMSLAVVLLPGCAGITSMSPPPRVDTTIEIAARPSTVSVPISIDVKRIDQKLNRSIPQRLFKINEDKKACVPAQYVEVCPTSTDYWMPECPVGKVRTQVAPAIDCRLDGSVYRGYFQTTAGEKDGQAALHFAVPVTAKAELKGQGTLGKAISGNVQTSLEVSGNVLPDLTEDWQPTATVDKDFEWTEEPYFEVLGFRIPISEKVEPRIRDAMSEMQVALEEEIASLELRETMETLWNSGFFVERISEKPEVWIRFVPTDLGFSGFTSADGLFKAQMLVTGETETFVGKQPASVEPTPLPPLKKSIPPGDFRLYVPVFADYDYSARLLEDLLQVGEKQFFEVPVAGRVALTFRDVDVYPTTGGAVAVGITVDVDYSRAGLIDGTGLIWLKAKMAIDSEQQIVYPSSLDFGADTDSSMLNMVVGIARRTSVSEQIETALTYDFSDDLERGVAMANTAINRPLGNGVVMSGKITDAGLDRIKATENGIYMGLHTAGELQVRLTGLQN